MTRRIMNAADLVLVHALGGLITTCVVDERQARLSAWWQDDVRKCLPHTSGATTELCDLIAIGTRLIELRPAELHNSADFTSWWYDARRALWAFHRSQWVRAGERMERQIREQRGAA